MSAPRSYKDFVPYRFRDEKPAMLSAAPGVIVITSTGTYEVGADGQHRKRQRRA